MTRTRRSFIAAATMTGLTATYAGCIGGDPPEDQLKEAREYYDGLETIDGMLEEDYRSIGAHVTTPDGNLGEVFTAADQPFALDEEDFDEERPNLVFCELDEDGMYEPYGVGWSIPADETDGTPSLFGKEFHDPDDHHVPEQSEYYGLHAWVFDDDIDDPFSPVHPDLAAPSYVDELDSTRDTLDVFRAENEGSEYAEEQGYLNTESHIYDDGGLYGVKFYDPDRRGTEYDDPPILLYRMTDQWYYEFIGAEWYLPADEMDDAGTMFGQEFHEPMPGHNEETDQPEHVGVHTWLYRANPDGMFDLFNRVLE